MSAIVVVAGHGQPDESTADKAECLCALLDVASAYVEFIVERGEAKELVATMETMGKIESGISHPKPGHRLKRRPVGNGCRLCGVTARGLPSSPLHVPHNRSTA
jgi:hypothetical protein